MKPYRGLLLATAVLLVALPPTGCGDAEKFMESGDITLTADVGTVEVNNNVNFTVRGTPTTVTPAQSTTVTPAQFVDECKMDLQYRSKGASISQDWTTIPGTEPVRIFTLRPKSTDPLNVIARGKCIGSNEEWKYSSQVTVAVTDEILPVVTGVTLTVTPTSVTGGTPVIFTVSVTKEVDCTLRVNTIVNGNTYSNFTDPTWDTTKGGTYSLDTFATVADTSLVIATEAYCTENSSARTSATVTVSVLAGP